MPEVRVNGVDLYYEEAGTCIPGSPGIPGAYRDAG